MYQAILEQSKVVFGSLKNNKKVIISVILCIVFVAVGFAVKGRFSKTQSAFANGPSVTAEKGNVVELVSSTGTVQATTQIKLNFADGSSKLTAVNVKIGDHVKKGQMLATLDDSNARIQLKNAQANLETAKARLIQAKQGITPEDLAVQQSSVDKAYISLQSAKLSYETQKAVFNDRTLAYQQVLNAANNVDKARVQLQSTQSNLAAAKAKYEDSTKDADDDEIQAAEDKVDELYASVEKATYQYDNAETPSEVYAASSSLAQARANLNAAQKELNDLKDGPTSSTITQAKASLDQAQASADQAQISYNAALKDLEIANQVYNNRTEAKNQLEQSKNNYDQARVSYNAAIAQFNQAKMPPEQADIKAAQASVIQAEAELQQQQLAIDNVVLTSPIDGIVAQVNANVGETTQGANPFIVINSDFKEIQVMAQISQSDIGKIKVGQDAEFTTSTFQDKKFSGKVLVIYPEAATANGVTSYNVLLSVNDKEGLLRPGMTTNVAITASVHKNVLYIPTVALKELRGKDGVYLIDDTGNVKFQPVTIGLFASDKVEITEGLQVGDKVALRSPAEANRTTNQGSTNARSGSNNRSGGSPFGGMGGMGRRGF